MKVTIEVIPHSEQRYPTSGDWWYDECGELQIRVSSMGNWAYEMLVAHHELTEALLCKRAGIGGADVDGFDIAYEKARDEGATAVFADFLDGLPPKRVSQAPITAESEPGDDPGAPYYTEHQIATGFERIMAAKMEVDWHLYEQANLDLYAEGCDDAA